MRDANKIKLNACYMNALLFQKEGFYEYGHMQSTQKDNIGLKDTGHALGMVQRIQKFQVGSYGVGAFRFLSKEHYEVFKSLYPHLSQLLNPSNDFFTTKPKQSDIEDDLVNLKYTSNNS